MRLKQSILTIGGLGIVTSLLGLVEGMIMGTYRPAYYRAYSHSTKDFTDEELRSVAIGLGIEVGAQANPQNF